MRGEMRIARPCGMGEMRGAVPHLPPPRLRRLASAAMRGAVLASLAATATSAQEPGDTARRVGLDTLVVEVLRTPLPVARAPFAVSAVEDAAIRGGRPGMALDEALAGVPGVQVDNRYNHALGERISVRGFGARAQFGVRGVRVLVDGIPATMADGQTTLNHVDLGSIARAEVARGPAGALYGNASGGVVHLTTAPPPDGPIAGAWRVTGGADGLLRLHGAVGGRAGDAWWRASASRLRYDGFREHADADTWLAGATGGVRGATRDLSLSFHAARYDARNPGGLTDTAAARDPHQAFAGNKSFRTGEVGRHAQLGARLRQALGPAVLEASAYGLTRSVDNPIPGRIVDVERRAGGARASLSAPFLGTGRWTAGGEAALQRDARGNYQNVGGTRGDVTLLQRERVTSAAAFAQAAAPLGPRVDVLAALRWDRVRFSVRDRLVSESNPDDGGFRTMSRWSPSAGVAVRPGAGVTVYANVATAFETPTTTELANRPTGAGGFNPDLQPQRTRSFEAGARAMRGGTAFELAAYHARIRGALVPFEVPDAPGRQFFRNAGSAVHRGVEAAASSRISEPLRARVAYTLTDARFDEYAVGAATYDGNRVPGVAPHRVQAALGWEDAEGPFAWAEGRWSSRTQVNDANDQSSPAHTVVDVRGGWRGLRVGGARTMPFVGITNLLDRAYNASVVVNAFGRRYFEPGPGRALYAGVEVEVGR